MFNHKGVNKNALDFGTLFHDFMAQIKTADDIAGALAFFSENFSLSMDMIENLQNRASQVFQNEHLKGLFTGNDNVRNEENIITPNGVVRPDRLNFHQDGSLTILDYKTGRPQEEHVSQITGYSKVLEEMGYAIKQKLIVYMEDQEIIVNKL